MFKRILRKDGSVIILLPRTDTQAVTFEVMYKVGSRQESKALNGVSHFVEHLMFKGTKKRPNTAAIAKELDGVGAEYNAFTGKDHTGYYITADARHLKLAIEMLSDMLHNSKFDPVEMDRERGVIIEEINMYEDNPLMYIEDLFEQVTFRGTSLGRDIAGPRENIRNISREQLHGYYKKYYYPSNAIFGIAGKFSEEQAVKLVDRYFPIGSKRQRVKINKIKKIKQAQPGVIVKHQKAEQVQLVLGWRGISVVNPNYIFPRVIGNILGGNMSSRLFIEIRERMGLCYSIKSWVHGYEDISAFRIQAGLNKDKIEEAVMAIKSEVSKMKNKGISNEELSRAKENIRGRMILSLENASNHLSFLTSQEILGKKLEDLEDVFAKLNKVTRKDVNNAIKRLINWKQVNLAIIGPFKDKNKFKKLLLK